MFHEQDQMPRRHYEYQTEDPHDVIASIQAAEAGDFVVAMASSAGSGGTDSTSCALDADSSLIAACRKLVISSFKDSFIYPVVGLQPAPPSGSLGQQTPLEIFRHDSLFLNMVSQSECHSTIGVLYIATYSSLRDWSGNK